LLYYDVFKYFRCQLNLDELFFNSNEGEWFAHSFRYLLQNHETIQQAGPPPFIKLDNK